MPTILSIPLKRCKDIDIIEPLQNFLSKAYGKTENNEEYINDIYNLQKLRRLATKNPIRSENNLEQMMMYYDQLVSLEMKIPSNKVNINFKWKDAFFSGSIFGKKKSLTVPSFKYEKVIIHYYKVYYLLIFLFRYVYCSILLQ